MHLPYRNIRSRNQIEIFFVSAVSSLLLVRFYLYLTDYPQVGGSTLHIAHMLWGGLLMTVAILVGLTFIGVRAERTTALLGGLGFGIFIDELGKFITKDNNYFFEPTIGLIYGIFVILYLAASYLTRDNSHSSKEYQLNSLLHLEESISHDMDPSEKDHIINMLSQADQNDPLTNKLIKLVDSLDTVPQRQKSNISKLSNKIDHYYESFWSNSSSSILVKAVFGIWILLFVLASIVSVYSSIDIIFKHLSDPSSITYSEQLIIAQLISTAISAIFVLLGTISLAKSRKKALEQFKLAVLINLLLTQFLIFYQVQFEALPGFFFNLILLILLNYSLSKEKMRSVHES